MIQTLRCYNNRDFIKYSCPKCSLLLRDAVQTSCGHWLCKCCAEELFATNSNPKCPHEDCSELLTEDDGGKYFPDRFVRREIKKIVVKCQNTDLGCDWVGPFGDYAFHLPTCSYDRTPCQYCSEMIPSQEILTHQNKCTMKLERCPLAGFGCQLTDKLNSTDMHTHLTENIFEHLSIIANQMKKAHRISDHDNISCADSGISSADSSLSIMSFDPKIDLTVQRDGGGAYRGRSDEGGANTYRGRHDPQQLMEVYRERYFPQALVKGAAQYPTRGDIDKLQADMYTKDSQIASLKQQVAKLEKAVQSKSTKNEDSDFRLSLIENANYDGSMIWKIPQFSQRMEDARSGKYTSIFSLPFYSSRYGYKMCLRLYILGDGIGKSTHMSLFFVVMKGEFDAILQWPFTHKVSFRLINQHHGRDVVDVFQPDPMSSSFQRPKTDMNVASGCPRFISHAELNQGGFIAEDTIFIKVKVDTSAISHH